MAKIFHKQPIRACCTLMKCEITLRLHVFLHFAYCHLCNKYASLSSLGKGQTTNYSISLSYGVTYSTWKSKVTQIIKLVSNVRPPIPTISVPFQEELITVQWMVMSERESEKESVDCVDVLVNKIITNAIRD